MFYRDGETKLGVLFEDYHRQYVPFENIPQAFVHAIVAAEDKQFFSHYGIDITGISRAFLANIKAGRVVQGAVLSRNRPPKISLNGNPEATGPS